jgi:uncharacterized integral membrane protein
MNKVKAAVWLVVFGFIALVVFQNEDYFLNTPQHLRLNLHFFNEYRSPSLPPAVFHLLFFILGAGVVYGIGAAGRFRLRQTLKRLRNAGAAQEKELLALKAELAQIKGEPLPAAQNAAVEASVTSPSQPA